MSTILDALIMKVFESARGPLDTSDAHTLIEAEAGCEVRLCRTFDRIREMAAEGTLRVVGSEGHPLTYELVSDTCPNQPASGGAEPAVPSVHVPYDEALNEAGWLLSSLLSKHGPVSGRQFNNLKPILKEVIERYLSDRLLGSGQILADAHSKDPLP